MFVRTLQISEAYLSLPNFHHIGLQAKDRRGKQTFANLFTFYVITIVKVLFLQGRLKTRKYVEDSISMFFA